MGAKRKEIAQAVIMTPLALFRYLSDLVPRPLTVIWLR